MPKKILFSLFIYIVSNTALIAQDNSEILVNGTFLNQDLYSIFQALEERYGITIDYESEVVPNVKVLGISFSNRPLERVFETLLKEFEVDFLVEGTTVKIRKKGVRLKETPDPTRVNFTLEGKIIDQNSGETLPYAAVYLPDIEKGTTSNVDGFFTLFNTPSDTSIIVVQYIGYKTLTLQLLPESIDGNFITIELEQFSEELEEIVVTDQKEHMIKASNGVSSVSISPAQLSSLPSLGEKDIFRSLQMLPGISATNETSSGLFVRGGTPDQNLILFDGFTVYHVDHFYGFFSAFNANAVKDIQFYKGGFEPKYGGRLSSVAVLTGKNGNTNNASGNFGISALSANGSLELPFADGRGSMFLSARRSYTDIVQSGIYNNIFGLFEEESESDEDNVGPQARFGATETEPAFYFYDLNAKATYRPSNSDILSFSFYNGQDKLDNSSDFNSSQFGGGFGGGGGGSNFGFSNDTKDVNDWGNVGSSLRWGRQWNNRLYSNSVLSYSKYFTNRDLFTTNEITRADSTFEVRDGTLEDNNVIDFTFKNDNDFQLNQNHTISFGLQYTYNNVDYTQIRNDTTVVLDRNDKGSVLAGYIQDSWKLFDRLTLNYGVRINQYSETNDTYVEPRASFSFKVSPSLTLKGAWGYFNQFVTRVVREDVSQGSRDFWLLANDELNPVSSATHYIAGISYETAGFLFDIEGYHKDMTGLSEYTLRFSNSGFFNSRTTQLDEFFYEGTGYSRGIEFLAQKKFGKYTGWLGYTLSETIHEFPDLSEDPYPALHDQTHEFKFVNSLRLGDFNLSGTWVYATGKPYTSPTGGYEITLLDGVTNTYVAVGDKNEYRLADYHRLDLSGTYGWDWGAGVWGEVGLSIFNAYNNTNTWYKKFEIIEGDLITTDVNTIGFTPNIFFNIKF